MKNIVRLFIVLLFLAAQAAAQNSAEKMPPSIRTSGEAIIMAKPDQARIDIGVVTQADSSQAAVEQNARKLEAVLARLRQLLGANADIKTVSYTVSPNYRYPKEGGEPTIAGYTATNLVRVILNDLTQIGRVIDAATQNGANRIQNIRFMLKDENTTQAQALREAAAKARAKAETLASALGVKILRIQSVIESSPAVVPVRDAAFARTESASTQIEPGMIEVRATVSMTVEISQ